MLCFLALRNPDEVYHSLPVTTDEHRETSEKMVLRSHDFDYSCTPKPLRLLCGSSYRCAGWLGKGVSSSFGMTDLTMKTQRLSRKKLLFFSLLAMLMFFVTLEAVLRTIGYEYYSYVKYMNFQRDGKGIPTGGFVSDPDSQNRALYISHKKDPRLFWRNVPNSFPVNAQGFVTTTGRVYSIPKGENVFRIVCLGCSCTNKGWFTYPERLEVLLNRNNSSEISFEVINAGVGGYSSYQGMRYFSEELLAYSPDLVTVYFGWNDHWRAIHYPDKAQRQLDDFVVQIQNILGRTRVYQFLHKVMSMIAGFHEAKPRSAFQPRVSIADYHSNIEKIIVLAKENGARVTLITAPHAINPASIAHYRRLGLITADVDLIRMHQEYNDVVRQLASLHGVALMDLESFFDEMEDKGSYFELDGVHPREEGLQAIAVVIWESLRKHGMIPNAAHEPKSF
jgi:lysophospholipase L1-like esterase